MPPQTISWTTKEYEPRQHSVDWFWAVGIGVAAIAVTSVILGNLLFAVFVVFGAITLLLYTVRHPRDVAVALTPRGLMIDATLFPYATLESFWIADHALPNKLIVKSKKVFMPHIVLNIEGIVSEEVRAFLAQYLKEEELHEPLPEKLMDALGF